jgi:hypothetical protein
VQALCASPTSSSLDAFVASAGLAVEFAGAQARMPLLRIDRHGFTVSVTDDAQLPPLGLPRPARIVRGDETLCEPRLVARCPVHGSAPVREIVLQPSRSDDDIAFWQALHAHRPPQGSSASAHPATADRDSLQAASSPALSDSQAIFTLRDGGDAAFFAAWLEYHFAEAVARARVASTPAELHDIVCRTQVAHAMIGFEYRSSGKPTQAATRETCAWIAAEVEQLFGLSPSYAVAGTRARTSGMNYRQRPPTLAS